MDRMGNPRPKTISIRDSQSDTANFVELYGADIHDVGDDGLDIQGSDIRVEGTRIWNIDEGTHDPGYGGAGGATDAFHNDSIQTGGGAYRVAVQHSYIAGKIQWGAQTGNVRDSQFDDLWMAGSRNAGIIVDSWEYPIAGHLKDIRSFGNRYGFRVDVKKSAPIRLWPEVYYPTLTTSGIDTTAPSGTLDSNGKLIPSAVLEHIDNPANRWRGANSYDMWPELLS
jgi:hypothetical protein